MQLRQERLLQGLPRQELLQLVRLLALPPQQQAILPSFPRLAWPPQLEQLPPSSPRREQPLQGQIQQVQPQMEQIQQVQIPILPLLQLASMSQQLGFLPSSLRLAWPPQLEQLPPFSLRRGQPQQV